MAAQLETTYRWKTRDLERLPDVPELRYEIVNGELIVSRRPFWKHQKTIGYLVRHFFDPVEARGGHVLSEPGIVWGESAEDNVVPDVAVILSDRLHILSETHLTGVPNIVIEVVSEGSIETDYVKKRHLYQRAGAQEYWIVDFFERRVEVWRFARGTATMESFTDGDTVTTPLVPGVSIVVSELWP
jgi:Uma2 family endonuclease